MTDALAIRLEQVTKTYPSGNGHRIHALREVDLDLTAGEVVALQGPSGSGKSTLLHVIGAMDRPDTGTITVGDTDITSLHGNDQTAYRRTIGFVFQRFNLLPTMTLLDNVIAPVLPYRTTFHPPDRARDLLHAVGLHDRMDSTPAKLSGGQQQRVAIARALINQPGLILADEPTGNLDSDTGSHIMDLLLDINHDHGTTIVLATHDAEVAARCHHTIRVHDGHVTTT